MPKQPNRHRPCYSGKRTGSLKEYDRRRGSAASRGYGYRWRKERAAYLAVHPLCVACERQGLTTEASVVDHITPHKGDEALFWNRDNWQAMCKKCHDRKTLGRDARG